MKPKADIATIAGIVGVSKTTVHFALHDKPGVSQPVRERILAVAQEIGYRPNRLAMALRTRRSATLGVVMGQMGSFQGELLASLEKSAQARGFNLLWANASLEPQREREQMELMLEKAVEGLIVTPTDSEANRSYYEDLLEQGTPLVCVDYEVPGLAADLVASDHFRGGYLAADRLIRGGRRRLAMLLKVRTEPAVVTSDRRDGFRAAVAEHGLEPAAELGVPTGPPQLVMRAAYEAVRDHLQEVPDLDGLFAFNDGLAYPAIAALQAAGRNVPRDVAVIGHDDWEASAYYSPPLSTIRQPVEEIGARATELLIGRLQGEITGPPQRILIEPSLVTRESCG
ncbi:MAG TPA: LacI family DNA-binding transcriptional regulator [Armatimonadota bacterium]|jgi:LacI family transcriptional regulator